MLIALVLEEMLADLGQEVVGIAGNLSAALQMAKQSAFDVAILDVNLNGKESYPVADELARRGIPFAFATGYDPRRVHERYPDKPTLTKPINQADLEAAIRTPLSRRA